ncbi:MAG: thiamine phosphate synthase [Pyrinomonadaceae bacterium]|nr:thiamine phosphate synthase [Pyrinomonadaceae bacterium]
MTFDKKLRTSLHSRAPIIYLITRGNLNPQNFSSESKKTLEIIEFAAETQVSLIQIREKLLTARLRLKLAREAVSITRKSDTKVLINERADIAAAAGADGIHLTSSSISPEIIRKNFQPDLIVGASTHSFTSAEKLKSQGADFVTYGPVFPTPSKAEYGAPKGLKKLRELCERLKPFPVLALGGVNDENYRTVLNSGARGFAAIRFLNDLENLGQFR